MVPQQVPFVWQPYSSSLHGCAQGEMKISILLCRPLVLKKVKGVPLKKEYRSLQGVDMF
jgi:hypothetical protein